VLGESIPSFPAEVLDQLEASRREGKRLCERAIARGLWLRPLGEVVPVLPAVTASSEQLEWLGVTLKSIFLVQKNPNFPIFNPFFWNNRPSLPNG
jgi:hypothetical protein